MKKRQTCPTCLGKKIIPGHCECNAEWRAIDDDDRFDDCRCEPDSRCPDCMGTGYVDIDV